MEQIQLKMTNCSSLLYTKTYHSLSASLYMVTFQKKDSGALDPIANMASDYEFSELEDNEAIKKEYRGYPGGLVRLKKGDWTLQPATAKLLPEYKSMEVRQSDIWIVTYPKVG